MNAKKLRSLSAKARYEVMRMLINAKSGHPGSSLGLADFFVAMYFQILNRLS